MTSSDVEKAFKKDPVIILHGMVVYSLENHGSFM